MLPKLEVLCEQIPSGVVITDRRGQILEVNAAFCGLLGYTATELKNQQMRDITYRESYEEASDSMQSLLVEGRLPALELEKRFICKNKSLVWTHVCLKMVLDEIDATWYGVFMVLDLSERKRVEQELRRYHQLKEFIFEELNQRVNSNQLLLDQLVKSHFYASAHPFTKRGMRKEA